MNHITSIITAERDRNCLHTTTLCSYGGRCRKPPKEGKRNVNDTNSPDLTGWMLPNEDTVIASEPAAAMRATCSSNKLTDDIEDQWKAPVGLLPNTVTNSF